MQYLTLTKSPKKLKYSQSLFDQSSFESLKISLSRQLAWRGGVVVGRRTCDLVVAGSSPGRDAAA